MFFLGTFGVPDLHAAQLKLERVPGEARSMRLKWNTIPGHEYELQWSENLVGWEPVTGFPQQAAGALMEHLFLAEAKQGFFRLVQRSEAGPGDEILVLLDGPPEGYLRSFSTGTDGAGNLFLLWHAYDYDPKDWTSWESAHLQRFSRTGNPLGEPIVAVDSREEPLSIEIWDPVVAVAPDGGFAVLWLESDYDGDSERIMARFFNAEGERVGENRTLVAKESGWDGDFDLSTAVIDSDGNLVVAWMEWDYDDVADSGRDRIFVQVFDSDGHALGTALMVAETYDDADVFAWYPVVLEAPDGGYDVYFLESGWPGADRIEVRTFNAGGFVGQQRRLVSFPTTIIETFSAARDATGLLRVAWMDHSAGLFLESAVMVQTFGPDEQPISDPVNIAHSEPMAHWSTPRIVALPAGGYAVVWREHERLVARYVRGD